MIDAEKLESYNLPNHIISEAIIVEFEQYRGLKDIQIVVSQLKTGLFQGVCNYAFWGPGQGSPYRSIYGQPTIELAIWDAFSGIRNYDKAEYPNECVFFVKHQGTEATYINGNGQIVTLSQAKKERENFWRRTEVGK